MPHTRRTAPSGRSTPCSYTLWRGRALLSPYTVRTLIRCTLIRSTLIRCTLSFFLFASVSISVPLVSQSSVQPPTVRIMQKASPYEARHARTSTGLRPREQRHCHHTQSASGEATDRLTVLLPSILQQRVTQPDEHTSECTRDAADCQRVAQHRNVVPRRHASADEATDSTRQDCVIAHALDNGSHWYANLRLCCARSTFDAIF